MEENYRPETPPRPDLVLTEGCRNELTWTSSDASSITMDNSNDFIHQNTNASSCTTWTDEKHNSYLDYLEASFVKQLHHALGLLSQHSEQNKFDSNTSQQLPASRDYSSDQFTVLQNGSWQKIKFERSQPLLHSTAGSHVVMESPWIGHFRRSGKRSSISSVDLRECSMLHSEGIPLGGKRAFYHGSTSLEWQCLSHHDEVGTLTGQNVHVNVVPEEVSDQNFVDEEKSSSFSRAKRLKMDVADAAAKDEIEPSGNLLKAETSTWGNTSLEERVHHKCPPENIGGFGGPKNLSEGGLK